MGAQRFFSVPERGAGDGRGGRHVGTLPRQLAVEPCGPADSAGREQRDFTVEAGELVARSGFGHEGLLRVSEIGFMSETPGLFQIDLTPFGRNYDSDGLADGTTHASERALVFPSSVDTWPAAVYLPTTLPVRATALDYADGERAGIAACAGGEQGIRRHGTVRR